MELLRVTRQIPNPTNSRCTAVNVSASGGLRTLDPPYLTSPRYKILLAPLQTSATRSLKTFFVQFVRCEHAVILATSPSVPAFSVGRSTQNCVCVCVRVGLASRVACAQPSHCLVHSGRPPAQSTLGDVAARSRSRDDFAPDLDV